MTLTVTRTRTAIRTLVWVLAGATVVGGAFVTGGGTRWPSVYYMTGASMEPAVAARSYFLAWSPPDRLSRGDLVLFRFVDEDGEFHVLRRLAGLPGDTVAMADGAVLLNGTRQDWPYRILKPAAWRSALSLEPNLYRWGPWVVPSDSVLLLADTRDMLGWPDSRFIGFVAQSDIVARAVAAR